MSIDHQLRSVIATLIDGGIGLDVAMETIEGKYIAAALTIASGRVNRAATLLQIHRNTLHNKIRLGIVPGHAPRPRRRRVRA